MFTEKTVTTCNHERNNYPVAFFDFCDFRADFFYNSHKFMAENIAIFSGWNFTPV
ncbi:Uncharacterised protein [Mycobacteroides abscessus subsp. abscessus]|nr:Uncharacterised protein [Mycobacteroides abscessus subsp. abscessus]